MLATLKSEDFVYTCDSHLSDPCVQDKLLQSCHINASCYWPVQDTTVLTLSLCVSPCCLPFSSSFFKLGGQHTEDCEFERQQIPTDPSATLIAPTGPSADDIRKVIADYSARETRRTALKDEAEKNKDEDKDKKPEEKKGLVGGLISSVSSSISSLAMGDTEEKKDSKPSSPAPASPGSPTTTGIPSVPAQTHKKYTLHRTFFENRRAELRRREQTARAKEVSKGELRYHIAAQLADMPQVPRGF